MAKLPQNSRQAKQIRYQRLNHRIRCKGFTGRPSAGYRGRFGASSGVRDPFSAPETWHSPREDGKKPRFVVQPPGEGYRYPVTVSDVRERLAALPASLTRDLHVVQFSRMTRKRHAFPCYGMQWGWTIYLYPIEVGLVEERTRPPLPAQQVEARMFGARWVEEKGVWKLIWTEPAIKDYYLNNILIHELGHLIDNRNTSRADRERFAEWFAVEYGYRATGGRRARAG